MALPMFFIKIVGVLGLFWFLFPNFTNEKQDVEYGKNQLEPNYRRLFTKFYYQNNFCFYLT
jgi:hypothetical protein